MDLFASNWNESDDANTAAAPDGLAEGCAPSGVNNWARATMGAAKRYVNQQSPKTTGGTSTQFTLTYTVAPGALYDGATHLVQFNAANGDAPTLNVNSLGAIPLHYYSAGDWRAVPAGLWGANQILRVAYNSSAGTYRILGREDTTGEIRAYAGASAPAGTLLCYGQAISRTAYVGLFTALGTAHGVGNGTTTFNLPDLRGRVAAGKDDMGGSSAARLNLIAGTTLGAAGGAQTPTGPSDQQSVDAGSPTTNVASINHTHTGGSIQPTMILNYVIRI
jgi:microcystin-dependent protein